MVPAWITRPERAVTITGVLELLGAIGVLIPVTAPYAAIGLAILLVAMFPANVRAAREHLTIAGRPVPALAPRTALQVVFLAAVLTAGLW